MSSSVRLKRSADPFCFRSLPTSAGHLCPPTATSHENFAVSLLRCCLTSAPVTRQYLQRRVVVLMRSLPTQVVLICQVSISRLCTSWCLRRAVKRSSKRCFLSSIVSSSTKRRRRCCKVSAPHPHPHYAPAPSSSLPLATSSCRTSFTCPCRCMDALLRECRRHGTSSDHLSTLTKR